MDHRGVRRRQVNHVDTAQRSAAAKDRGKRYELGSGFTRWPEDGGRGSSKVCRHRTRCIDRPHGNPVSYTHLTLPTIYSV